MRSRNCLQDSGYELQ